jgi:hypothetical protein
MELRSLVLGPDDRYRKKLFTGFAFSALVNLVDHQEHGNWGVIYIHMTTMIGANLID